MNLKDGYVGWKRLDGLRDDGREVLKRQRKHHFYHPKILYLLQHLPIFYLKDELMVFKTLEISFSGCNIQ